MQPNTSTETKLLVHYRYWIILGGIVLMLPPLSLLFQFTQDTNFCGSWCPRMFFVWRKGMTSGQYLMGFVRSYMGVVLVAGILLTTVFFGRYWCSHLCPVGGTMEIGSRLLPDSFKINLSGIPAAPVRYGYLSVYFIAAATGIGSLCCNYCNFATVPRMFGAAFSGADLSYFLRTAGLINLGLIVCLGFISKGGRGYCNFMCPIGAIDALTNIFTKKIGRRMTINNSRCNACGKCRDVCPTWSVTVTDQASINQLSCMPCRICEKVCPREAIGYGKTKR